jgi:hypothetical protein
MISRRGDSFGVSDSCEFKDIWLASKNPAQEERLRAAVLNAALR